MIELERSMSFYESRSILWTFFKSNKLKEMCTILLDIYKSLLSKWKVRKGDGMIQMQIEWTDEVVKLCLAYDVSDFGEIANIKDKDFHLNAIIHTVGKYVCSFLKRNNVSTLPTSTGKTYHKKQSDSGLQVLAGGILGEMFKLFNRRKTKYQTQKMLLSYVVINDKTAVLLPVEQRDRDHGGLYCIQMNFLPVLRELNSYPEGVCSCPPTWTSHNPGNTI